MYFVNQTSKYNNPFRDGCFDSRYNALKIHNLLTTRRSHSEFYQPCKNDEILKYILALIICKIKALYYIQLYGFATPKNLYATYSILLLHCNWKFTYTYKSVIRDSKFFAGFSAHQEFFRLILVVQIYNLGICYNCQQLLKYIMCLYIYELHLQ